MHVCVCVCVWWQSFRWADHQMSHDFNCTTLGQTLLIFVAKCPLRKQHCGSSHTWSCLQSLAPGRHCCNVNRPNNMHGVIAFFEVREPSIHEFLTCTCCPCFVSLLSSRESRHGHQRMRKPHLCFLLHGPDCMKCELVDHLDYHAFVCKHDEHLRSCWSCMLFLVHTDCNSIWHVVNCNAN